MQNVRCVEATISGKHIKKDLEYGRTKAEYYHIIVEAEDHRFEKSVEKKRYDACEIGGMMEVFFFDGALGIETAIVNIK